MDWSIIICLTPLIIIFTICGIQLLRGKWLMLIAGYNTAPKKERDKMNGAALGKLMGNILLICAFLMLTLALFPTRTIIYFTLIAVIILSFGSLIYVNKSDRFTKKD